MNDEQRQRLAERCVCGHTRLDHHGACHEGTRRCTCQLFRPVEK